MPSPSIVFATATYKTAGGRVRSADTRAARALRGLQMLDQMQGRDMRMPWIERTLLLRALDALGSQLSLACTADAGGSPEAGYEHNGDTCPVHEFLVPDDYNACDIPGDYPDHAWEVTP